MGLKKPNFRGEIGPFKVERSPGGAVKTGRTVLKIGIQYTLLLTMEFGTFDFKNLGCLLGMNFCDIPIQYFLH